MPERCKTPTPHDRHEWYWRGILRRDCPGLVVVRCNRDETHIPHWHGERPEMWCRGAGLAAVCEHGIGMLNQCDDCAVEVGGTS